MINDFLYWVKRIEKYNGCNHKISNLIKQQYGRSAICREQFTPMDFIEADHHIVPRAKERI
jgi:hypothetical protein